MYVSHHYVELLRPNSHAPPLSFQTSLEAFHKRDLAIHAGLERHGFNADAFNGPFGIVSSIQYRQPLFRYLLGITRVVSLIYLTRYFMVDDPI